MLDLLWALTNVAQQNNNMNNFDIATAPLK